MGQDGLGEASGGEEVEFEEALPLFMGLVPARLATAVPRLATRWSMRPKCWIVRVKASVIVEVSVKSRKWRERVPEWRGV